MNVNEALYGAANPSITLDCRKNIKLSEERVADLQSLQPAESPISNCPEMHTEVGVCLTCSDLVYSLSEDMFQEKTDMFILSPDGQTVMGRIGEQILPGKLCS